jgi:DNA-binding NtrC family response regulator
MTCLERNSPAVLIVDDEPAILSLLADVLRRHGLEVFTANRGDKAVEIYSQHRDSIDLVLLDVEMFPWDGPRTLAELRRLSPHVRAAFMSGSVDDIEALFKLDVLRVFPKPFPSVVALAAILRELIKKKPASVRNESELSLQPS